MADPTRLAPVHGRYPYRANVIRPSGAVVASWVRFYDTRQVSVRDILDDFEAAALREGLLVSHHSLEPAW